MNYGYGAARILDKSGNGFDGTINGIDAIDVWSTLAPDTLISDRIEEKVVLTSAPYETLASISREGRYTVMATA